MPSTALALLALLACANAATDIASVVTSVNAAVSSLAAAAAGAYASRCAAVSGCPCSYDACGGGQPLGAQCVLSAYGTLPQCPIAGQVGRGRCVDAWRRHE